LPLIICCSQCDNHNVGGVRYGIALS
jgi:hypothetical protein